MPSGVLRRQFAQWRRVQYHVNGVAHLYGNVLARGLRRTVLCSLTRLDLSNDGYLIL
jgi:hypothetical protein